MKKYGKLSWFNAKFDFIMPKSIAFFFKLYKTTGNDEKIVINHWRSRMQFMNEDCIYCVTVHFQIVNNNWI